MKETIYIHVGEKLRILDDDGNPVLLTCVESLGCESCYFKQQSGRKQHEACQALACGGFERLDGVGVIFQAQKEKEVSNG